MLLPPDPLVSPEEQTADPRAELVQRLVEHEKFKNAAQLLYQKQQIEENVWSKPDKSLYNDEGTEGELVVSLVDLVKVFQQVLERRKEVSRIDLQHEQFGEIVVKKGKSFDLVFDESGGIRQIDEEYK